MSPLLTSSLLLLGWVLSARAAEDPPRTTPPLGAAESIAGEVRHVFEQCQSAVTKIEAIDAHGPLSGSGFFVDPSGTIFTSYTIGGESREIVVSLGSAKYPAHRLVADPRSGIAILKVEAQTPFLLPGRSRELKVASPVISIGYPMDLPLTPSFGTIGGFDLKHLGRYFATTHIRANVAVQRGEGGAPLLNMNGEVVGILISSLDSGSASFALPIEAALKVYHDFLRFHEVRPGWMGLKVVPTTDPIQGSRAQVETIITDGPAERGGLQKGDILLEIGGRKISVIEDVLDASFYITAEDELAIKVARQDEQLELHLHPSEHPNFNRQPPESKSDFSALTPSDLRAPLQIQR